MNKICLLTIIIIIQAKFTIAQKSLPSDTVTYPDSIIEYKRGTDTTKQGVYIWLNGKKVLVRPLTEEEKNGGVMNEKLTTEVLKERQRSDMNWVEKHSNALASILIGEIIFSMFFVLIPTMVITDAHKLLRNNKAFNSLICFAMLIAISLIYFLYYYPDQSARGLYLQLLSPITFLVLYKICDNIIKRKLRRHIYFSRRYGRSTEDEQQTWLELFMQMALFLSPGIWIGIGYWLYGSWA